VRIPQSSLGFAPAGLRAGRWPGQSSIDTSSTTQIQGQRVAAIVGRSVSPCSSKQAIRVGCEEGASWPATSSWQRGGRLFVACLSRAPLFLLGRLSERAAGAEALRTGPAICTTRGRFFPVPGRRKQDEAMLSAAPCTAVAAADLGHAADGLLDGFLCASSASFRPALGRAPARPAGLQLLCQQAPPPPGRCAAVRSAPVAALHSWAQF